ncbi:tRNA (adenosine(37)-N6)-threonylcarbamoyltransferase complex ATPase subunit type 1 TsaE [Desulfovibrio inopinatus]|uniref:tRNA (adenosine(37)-N6)-threonylcarbamoyltransferase complex ATPase subunit type 1 TsaE n=1 Tax=Desulfovibrio inopinatus TaxID=102109 RepID=UPI0004023D9A|nr:tRNA (adenosine(37)-N6)-threonylcarbamoyltransferase complex ATPase subunit type 1 TsaE [Desulfovibrio inopinatus]
MDTIVCPPIELPDVNATLALGHFFTYTLTPLQQNCIICLKGEMGSGKTTFVRGFIESLPGGENADVSSPSFNLANLYPTRPPTAHLDLYRLETEDACLTTDEYLDTPFGRESGFIIIEWAERLGNELALERHLDIALTITPTGRQAVCTLVTDHTDPLRQSICKGLAAMRSRQ